MAAGLGGATVGAAGVEAYRNRQQVCDIARSFLDFVVPLNLKT